MGLRSLYLLSIFVLAQVKAVPPEACFANFKWDDCGKSPIPVMYYWKPGSRCEVGLWRGCLPNLNMFQDEYECVTTCIFTARAVPEDYHSMHENEVDQITEFTTETVTESANITETVTHEVTTAVDGGHSAPTTVVSVTGAGNKEDNATVADDKATTAGGGGATGGEAGGGNATTV